MCIEFLDEFFMYQQQNAVDCVGERMDKFFYVTVLYPILIMLCIVHSTQSVNRRKIQKSAKTPPHYSSNGMSNFDLNPPIKGTSDSASLPVITSNSRRTIKLRKPSVSKQTQNLQLDHVQDSPVLQNPETAINYQKSLDQRMDKFRLHPKFLSRKRPRQFEDDDDDDDDKSDELGEHSNAQLTKEIKALEQEVKRLEGLRTGKGHVDDKTIHANLTFNLRWKKYRNLSDEDTMELKYEVVGKSKEAYAIQVLVYIVIPILALLLFLYTAISLYWTKCWFWKVVPPDRYYKFERYEIDQDEEPADQAPLMRTPLPEPMDLPESRPASPENNYRKPPRKPRQRSRSRNRGRGATDEAFAMSAYDYDAKPASGRSPERDYYRGKR